MAKQRQSLSGKVVAITGGARGIGKATATALVRKGCRVAIGDLDLELAEQTAGELGGGTVALPLDVTDRSSFAGFLDAAERELGALDVVINNAGIMPVTAFDEEPDDSIRRQLDINVYGVIVGTQLAAARLRQRGRGHIVNVASAAGKAPVPGIATYSGTKHAVVGFSEAVRGELRGTGVELSCVMPVTVNTALTEGVGDTLGVKKVEPEDVAGEIVDALEVPRFDVFVPSYLKYTIAIGSVLPRRAREAIARLLGTDKIMTGVSKNARRAYEERASREDIAGGGGVEEPPAEQSPEREAA
ncbi:MAG TPA: SDR family oxidoreductase [Solirubrobacterales bacterium]|nr:SDR family oxidoreductase [Solirubrobacterales bacterium]